MIKMRQQKINNMLKNIKSNKPYYNEYGKLLKINMFHIMFILDFVIPSFRLLTFIGYKLKHIEVLRITIKKD